MSYSPYIKLIGISTCLGLSGLQIIPLGFEFYRQRRIDRKKNVDENTKILFKKQLKSRTSLINDISSGNYGRPNDTVADILVIGGGATGTGVALDAVTRGLTTVCVEKFDFASGTSSRSTKLIHGGVRYLQKAIFNFDKEQYNMVKEALQERANLLDIAPHLAYPLPIMIPIYKLWQLPYYWVGIKLYDIVSGTQILKSSYVLTKSESLERFPLLRKDSLVGALVYYDGQHEDARMCLSIALTAIRYGAKVVNYTEVLELTKGPPHDYEGDPSLAPQVITGAKVRDKISGKEYFIKARVVVNATGPYTDFIRKMDNKETMKICQPSSGVHVVLPGYYSPSNMGLLDPATKDGRVIFFLPWLRGSLAGTTDTPCEVTDKPSPSEAEVNFILEEIRSYLSPDIKVRRGDVMSAWSGIRPLVMDLSSPDTQSIARNHIIEISSNNLVTIAGGKWTTYRSMAQETVDALIKTGNLKPKHSESQTLNLLLEGAHEWKPNLFIELVQEYGMETDVAQHLASTYGDKAKDIAQTCELTGLRWPVTGKRLHSEFPYIEAEVRWACKEYACRAVDFVARRSRLSFLNVHAAREALPRIVEIMGDELGWDVKKRKDEQEHAISFIENEMGLGLKVANDIPINFTKAEQDELVKQFSTIDAKKKGFITLSDLRKFFNTKTRESKDHIPEELLRRILNEIDLNKNGEIDLLEFLQFMSALKTGAVANSSFKHAMQSKCQRIPVDRSCGGV